MKQSRLVCSTLLIVAVFSFFTSCRKTEVKESTHRTQKVRVMLSWTPSAEHAFLYYGIKHEVFKNLGIEIIDSPSNGSVEVQKALQSGAADFGFISGDVIVRSRVEGVPIQSLITLFHDSPVTIYYLKSKNITKPQDLIGKRVACIKGSAVTLQFKLMLKKFGIDESQVVDLPSKGSPTEITGGYADAALHYTQYAPVMLRAQGLQIDELLLKDKEVNVLSTCIATTDQMIREKPELVQRVVNGMMLSLQKAEVDFEGTLAAILEREPALDSQATRESLKVVNDMIYKKRPEMRLGDASDDEWRRTQRLIREAGIIKQSIELSYFYDDHFTDAFYAGTAK